MLQLENAALKFRPESGKFWSVRIGLTGSQIRLEVVALFFNSLKTWFFLWFPIFLCPLAPEDCTSRAQALLSLYSIINMFNIVPVLRLLHKILCRIDNTRPSKKQCQLRHIKKLLYLIKHGYYWDEIWPPSELTTCWQWSWSLNSCWTSMLFDSYLKHHCTAFCTSPGGVDIVFWTH